MTTLSRRALYQQVWHTPMSRLARNHGLSDNGLRKICRKHDIPWPPAGYWQRLAHGKNPPRIPLPKAGKEEMITLQDKPETPPEKPQLRELIRGRTRTLATRMARARKKAG